ncbi:hypothetical protein BD769DRAFT_1388296 [Suillus cothurnatus]|nr:hypothetical protein BD769DRAFT_1388296 [Suillus cothurnatus]
MHASCAPLQKAWAVNIALACTAVQAEQSTFSLKEKDVIMDEVHDMICKLVAKHDIPVLSVQDIISAVANCLGIVVEGDINTHSIQHVLQEAEVAAEVQMVDKITQVDGSTRVTCFTGVQHEVNHTSKTQLQGWKDMIHEMCTMYNECMVGSMAGVADPRELVTKVKGMLTDHTEDQKKLICLFREWKEACVREV